MVPTLRLEPLPAGDIRRLIQTRLGVEPARGSGASGDGKGRRQRALRRGNPELPRRARRARVAAGKVEFDASAVAAALPASVQSLLTARVDRLAPQDRALLQAAAVIGRRFDPQLLAAAGGSASDIEPGSPRCRRSTRPSRGQPETMSSSTRWCATRSIRACSRTSRRAASEDRRGDRTPQRQSPGRGGRDARPSLQPDGSRRQSLHIYRDGWRKEPRRLFP